MQLATQRPTLLTREGIRWRNLNAKTVRIEIDIENPLDVPLDADTLVIEAAPFGAFLPWRPLAQIAVAPLAPREGRRVLVDVATDELPDDDLETGPSHPNWIGNLNVWFTRSPEDAVERHCAFDLSVPLGSLSAIGLVLEPGAEYAIEICGSNAEWRAEIAQIAEALRQLGKAFERMNARGSRGDGIRDLRETFRAIACCRTLEVRAPEHESRTEIEARVTRLTDGRVVPIQLSFVATRGEATRLGCVDVR